MPPCDDSIEQLASFAELHHQMHGLAVFVGGLELHDVGVIGKTRHYRNLTPDVLYVDSGPQLLLGYGLAGKAITGLAVGTEVGDAELAAAEFATQHVLVPDPSPVTQWNHVFQDPDRRRRPDLVVGVWIGSTFFGLLLSPMTVAVAAVASVVFRRVHLHACDTVTHAVSWSQRNTLTASHRVRGRRPPRGGWW